MGKLRWNNNTIISIYINSTLYTQDGHKPGCHLLKMTLRDMRAHETSTKGLHRTHALFHCISSGCKRIYLHKLRRPGRRVSLSSTALAGGGSVIKHFTSHRCATLYRSPYSPTPGCHTHTRVSLPVCGAAGGNTPLDCS